MTTTEVEGVITLQNITKNYAKSGGLDVPVLAGVDLKIEKGEFVAIMGPSGSGKSTLMNIIGCLDRPSGGRYLLDGVAVDSMGDDDLSRTRNKKIGFVFQSFNLLPGRRLDNVALLLSHSTDHRRQARARAADRGGPRRPDDHVPRAPGGQQRVAIARALANDPALILADEPPGTHSAPATICRSSSG
jgi:putative ABC transport system ATP-binding protein